MRGNVMIVCFVLNVAVVMITIKFSDVTNAIAVITSIALVNGKFLKVNNHQNRRDVALFCLSNNPNSYPIFLLPQKDDNRVKIEKTLFVT